MRLTLNDFRRYDGYRLCSRGIRAFAARHRIPWKCFLREGVEISKLRSLGDAQTDRVVKRVLEIKNGE